MSFDLIFAWSILPQLAEAALVTLQATCFSYAIAVVGGLLLALGRMHGPWPIRRALGFALEFIRSTPVLVQVFFLYFVMPRFGLRLPAFETGVLALALHYSAFLAEVFRAGIQSVTPGQWDAAAALGMRKHQAYGLVILPQVLPPMIPAFGNYLIAMFKDTPLLSALSVLEMMQTAKVIGSETFRYLEPFTLVALFFLAMSLVSAMLIQWAEQRFQRWVVR